MLVIFYNIYLIMTTIKQTFNFIFLQNFSSENNIELCKDYSKDKITRENIIEGKCITIGCCELFKKTFRMMVNNSNGYCINCTNKNRTEQFKLNSNLIHNSQYCYNLSEFKGVDNPITITCKEHGDFIKTPYHHINRKQGCKKCLYEKKHLYSEKNKQIIKIMKNMINKHLFIILVKNKYLNADNYSKLIYKGL